MNNPYSNLADYDLRQLARQLLACRNWDKRWEKLAQILCDLRFVEAKCCAGMTYELVADFAAALDAWPELQPERERERLRQKRLVDYATALVEYAAAWTAARRRHAADPEKDPLPPPEAIPLPAPPNSTEAQEEMWQTEAAWAAGIDPYAADTPAGRVQAFAAFVNTHAHILATAPQEAIPVARNYANAGPVVAAAEPLAEALDRVWVARDARPPAQPARPVCTLTVLHDFADDPSLSVTPDGRSAILVTRNSVELRDVATGRRLLSSKGSNLILAFYPNQIAPDGKTVVSRSDDASLRVWDLTTGRTLRVLPRLRGETKAVAMTPDAQSAICLFEDSRLGVVDVITGETVRTLDKGDDYLGQTRWVAITADGKTGMAGFRIDNSPPEPLYFELEKEMRGRGSSDLGSRDSYREDSIRVWNLATGQALRTLRGQREELKCLAITPDGKTAICEFGKSGVRLLDLVTGRRLPTLRPERLPGQLLGWLRSLLSERISAKSAAVTADGKTAVLADSDGTLSVWDVRSGKQLRHLRAHRHRVESLAITADGRTAVTFGRDRTWRAWDLARGQAPRGMRSALVERNSLGTAPGAKTGIVLVKQSKLRVWDLVNRRCVRTLSGVTYDWYRQIRPPWAPRHPPEHREQRCGPVVQTADGKTAVFFTNGEHHRTLWLWDLTGARTFPSMQHADKPFQHDWVCVTPDGRMALFSDIYGFGVWDLVSARKLEGLYCRTSTPFAYHTPVDTAAVAPTGRIVVGAHHKHLQLWQLATRQSLRELEGHTDTVLSVSVSVDGKTAVSASRDRTLRAWNLATGECQATFFLDFEAKAVSNISFTGQFTCTDADNGEVYYWTLRNIAAITPVITPVRLFHLQASGWWPLKRVWGEFDADLTAACLWCGKRFLCPPAILDTIRGIAREAGLRPEQSPCLELPDEAWDEPRLLSQCPHCRKPLKFNPFLVDNRQ